MKRIENPEESWRKFKEAVKRYKHYHEPILDKIRQKYTNHPNNPTGKVSPEADQSLEAHTRQYIVNALLQALNWRFGSSPEDGLPNINIIPESPVQSSEKGTVRFLDYFGMDGDENHPLIIIETKRGQKNLPKRSKAKTLLGPPSWESIICEGLSGRKIGGEWKDWLSTLKDYVKSVRDKSGEIPKRVVITNGEWLVLFADPADAFLEDGKCNPAKVFVFENYEDLEHRYRDLFDLLEYQSVLGKPPVLKIEEASSHIDPYEVEYVMHGLRLIYIKEPDFGEYFEATPVLKVMPLLIVKCKYKIWRYIDSQKSEKIPISSKGLPVHIEKINEISTNFLIKFFNEMGKIFPVNPLVNYYNDSENFDILPGITKTKKNSGNDLEEFLIVTGDKTHYLLKKSTVPSCPYHKWESSNAEQCASTLHPIQQGKVNNPRSLFVSGDEHHCTHQMVTDSKKRKVTSLNKDRCGLRSAKEGESFCEIWHFEEHLCCRTCVFEEVCTKAQVFQLPCTRPL